MTETGPSRPRVFRLPADDDPARERPESATAVRPRAFRLDPAGENGPSPLVTEQPDAFATTAGDDALEGEAAVEAAQRRGMLDRLRPSWAGLFWSALGSLVSLGLGLWVWRLIDDLFARVPSLGWVGLALGGLALLALLVMAGREVAGVARQRHVAALHARLAAAYASDDGAAARGALAELLGLYGKRGDTVTACHELTRLSGEIIDGRDLLDIAERQLMAPIDRRVRREIANAAKRVSAITAISPRAGLDLLVVIASIVVLIRRIAELYSGRPGLLGFLRLARSVGAHLAITGSMAVGDSLLQQAVGHGIAARLSARLGEGVLNGMLTTRVGLSAMAVCRPMPFGTGQAPGVKDVAPFLFSDRGTGGP